MILKMSFGKIALSAVAHECASPSCSLQGHEDMGTNVGIERAVTEWLLSTVVNN